MDRILKLINYYSEKESDSAQDAVSKLWKIMGASDNIQALEIGECALRKLAKVCVRKDHLEKLKSFLYDLLSGKKKYQPQL